MGLNYLIINVLSRVNTFWLFSSKCSPHLWGMENEKTYTLEQLRISERIQDLKRQIEGLELTLKVKAYSKKYHE